MLEKIMEMAKGLSPGELQELITKLSAAEPEAAPPETEPEAAPAEPVTEATAEPTAEEASAEPEAPPAEESAPAEEAPEIEKTEEQVVEEPAPEPEESPAEEAAAETAEEPASDDSPDEGEFFNGETEDIPAVKKDYDETAEYDPNADQVEMYRGEAATDQQSEPVDIQPEQAMPDTAEQGDIIAALQAKVTALEAENAQMKAKYGGNFGYGNAPSLATGRYQTRDAFINTLPQIRKTY